MLTAVEAILWFLRFLFGACIFSFLNVVIDRMPRGESVVKGRSHCTNCGRVLTAWELIPCFSFLALKGRCKGCKSQIPVRDFWSEVTGGAAFCGCVLSYGCGSSGILSLKGAVIFAYLGILLVVARIDWDTQIIYDRFHILILLLGKKLEKKDHFAFGPFLAFGLALAVFFGDQIVNWYLSLLS